jgi:nicotinamide-nucleotide amidase
MDELISKDFIDTIKDELVNRKQTLAVAESVTSGVLQAVCSAATEASKFFQGGITVYNLGQKTLHLGVEPIHALECDCVSEETAAQMATGICHLFNSDWGISITGYASPTPESGGKLFAYVAIAFKGAIVKSEKIKPLESEFFAVQLEYARKAIDFFKHAIDKK